MAASLLLLHHLLFKSPPPISSSIFIRPFRTIFNNPLSSPSPQPRRFFCSSSSPTYLQNPSLSPLLLQEDNISDFNSDDEIVQQEHQQIEPQNIKQEQEPESYVKVSSGNNSTEKLPSLSVKEKKELASYAHSLGKKLKCQQVGKSGVTSSVAASFVENLESNELLKLKIHNSCPGELADVVKQLEEATGSVAVGLIGRSVILYRPSLTKLKAAEKKIQARKVFVRKGFKLKPTETKIEQVLRVSGRGRRGSSRF